MPEKLTLKKTEELLETACRDGFFYGGEVFEYAPEISLKLLQDRKLLEDAAKKIVAMKKLRPDSPIILLLIDVLEKVKAGWPTEE